MNNLITSPIEAVKIIEHSTATAILDHRGIVWFNFKNDAQVELKHTHDYVDIINKICSGQKRYFILDTRNKYVTATKESRKFIGTNPAALRWRIADAMLLNSLPVRLLVNSYKKIDTPAHPVKVFGNEQAALKWFKSLENAK